MLKNLLNRFLPPAQAVPAAAPVAPPVAPPAAAPVVLSAAAPAVLPVASPAAVSQDVARADALVHEGNAREDAGDLAQAEALYRQAIAAAPHHPRGHLNLGIVLAAKGDEAGAEAAYEQVLAIDPAHPFGNYNQARLAFTRGDTGRAETLVAAALRAKPDFPQALVLQSSVLDALGRTDEAVDAIRAALSLQPGDAGASFNLALMLRKLDRFEEVERVLPEGLALDPDAQLLLEQLFLVLNVQGFAQEALAPLQRLVRLDPHVWQQRSRELLVMNFADGVTGDDLFRRHVEFGADLEREVAVRFDRYPERGDPKRRLRVGYLSADFLLHPVSRFLVPVLEHHDRSQVESFCYSCTEKPDAMTEQARAAADHWREVASLSDTELADAIHADGIDLLVDLMGHTSASRLAVFAQRPAPVQVAWLGYLGTTGMTRMDFRISDVRSDPPEIAQRWHTERLTFLPASQWCYPPTANFEIDALAPMEIHGHLTFGCFNSAVKVNSASCRRWAQVMLRTPGSRLLIGDIKSERKRSAIRRDMSALGVSGDRIEFLPRVSMGEYLGLYRSIDIAFDTFPYGGGTTTFDSLWMGVPVVAAVGDRSVSRSAASILTALGLEDWIAPTIDDFVDLAVARATDRQGLLAVRRSLRGRLQDSLLTEMPRYTRDLESAYRTMWLEKTA